MLMNPASGMQRLLTAAMFMLFALVESATADLVVELTPNNLSGDGSTWINSGTGGGTFDRVVGDGVLGVPTVPFDGSGVNAIIVDDEVFRSTIDASIVGVTGNAARTTEVWVLNPTVEFDEAIVGWGRRGADAQLHMMNYGTSGGFGALGLWGAPDTGWTGGVPAANQWHHLAYVFDGIDNYKVYVDGVLNVDETVGALDTQPGVFNLFGQNQADGTTADPDVSGFVDTGQAANTNLSGALNSVRIYDDARSEAEILNAFAAGPDSGPLQANYVLTVDRDTGSLTLTNNSGAPAQIVGYSLQSEFGSFDQTGWTPVAGNSDASAGGSFDPDDDWTILTASDSHTDLREFEFDGGDGGTLANGASLVLSISGAWIQSPTEDVEVEFTLDDGTTISPLLVFAGNGGDAFERSDLNFNGQVDDADWFVFRDNHLGLADDLSLAEAYQRGDLDGDGDNDFFDFRIFEADFDAEQGPGALAALISTSRVPEPSGTTVLLIGAATLIAINSRRTSLDSLAKKIQVVDSKANKLFGVPQ